MEKRTHQSQPETQHEKTTDTSASQQEQVREAGVAGRLQNDALKQAARQEKTGSLDPGKKMT